MRLHFVSADYPARVAKRLKRLLAATDDPLPLRRCHNVVAAMFGYADWHELSRSVNAAPPSLWDDEVEVDVASSRTAQYVRVLRDAGLGADDALRIVGRIGPSRRRFEAVGDDLSFILGPLSEKRYGLFRWKARLGRLSPLPGWSRFRTPLRSAVRENRHWAQMVAAPLRSGVSEAVGFLERLRRSDDIATWDGACLLALAFAAEAAADRDGAGARFAAIGAILDLGSAHRLAGHLSEIADADLASLVGFTSRAIGPLLLSTAASDGLHGLRDQDTAGIEMPTDWSPWQPAGGFCLASFPYDWSTHDQDEQCFTLWDEDPYKLRCAEIKSVRDERDPDYVALLGYFRRLPPFLGGSSADRMQAFRFERLDLTTRELLLLRLPDVDSERSVGFAIVRKRADLEDGSHRILVEAVDILPRYQSEPVVKALTAILAGQLFDDAMEWRGVIAKDAALKVWLESRTELVPYLFDLQESFEKVAGILAEPDPHPSGLDLRVEVRRGVPEAPRRAPFLRHVAPVEAGITGWRAVHDHLADLALHAHGLAVLASRNGKLTIKLGYTGRKLLVRDGVPVEGKHLVGLEPEARMHLSALLGSQTCEVVDAVRKLCGLKDDIHVVAWADGTAAAFQGRIWRRQSMAGEGPPPVLLLNRSCGDLDLDRAKRDFWSAFRYLRDRIASGRIVWPPTHGTGKAARSSATVFSDLGGASPTTIRASG